MGFEEFRHEYCDLPENISCTKKFTSVLTNVILYSIYMTACLLTVIGNVLVIISISHFKQLQTPTNVLVRSMAITDFMIGLFIMPLEMVIATDTCWHFGDIICLAEIFTYVVLTSISTFHLLFLAVDRYYAVHYPLLYSTKMTFNTAWIFVLISWIWPILENTLYYSLIMNVVDSLQNNCYQFCKLVINVVYTLIDFLFSFFIPCLVMLVLYGKIFIIVKQHVKAIENVKEGKQTEKENINGYQNKQLKATKTIAIIIFTFIICVLPLSMLNFINLFKGYPLIIYNIFNVILFLNFGLNPVIYGLFYPWFRKAFTLILSFRVFTADLSLTTLM